MKRHSPGLALALLACAAVALAATAPLAMLSTQAPAGAAVAAPPAPRWELSAAPSGAASGRPSAPAEPGAADAASARVWRERHTIGVAARQASRAEVARQLAVLTGVDPQRPAEALHAAPPLTLHWRGSDAAEAWRQVLGVHADHAVQCDAGRCRLWLVHRPVTLARTRDAATADPPPEDAAPAPADTAADTADGARNDTAQAPAPGDPRQPEPPGPFPVD